MNHYPAEEKINFSFERIKRDIDLICEVSDFIRELHFQGGEFFLHPNSAEIIDYALEKTKIGIVSVISNCVCKLDESDLDAMNHERFVLRVSDYADQLSMKQKRLFNTNIAKLEAYGISYLINNFEWIMPPDMRDLKHCEDRKIKNHSTCFHKESKRGRLIHNGIYYPCQRAKELAVHHVVDYPDNYLVIDTASSPEERKKIIIGLNERKFYPSCSHCDYTLPIVLPGEQGVEPAYQHLGYPVRQD
jgi:hypothetical protein